MRLLKRPPRVVRQVELAKKPVIVTEQALRFVVIDPRVTQRTRGVIGRRWCERVWTTLATCRMQRRSAFEHLHHVIRSHFAGRPAPSLLLAP